ncbi:conserved hypothetical protein [Leishmania major strain Friedlin]|uniref:PH domain-containing protein n=1 Tax=Leishmania major TaxID=5664 RepID=Q4Q7E6_LEIMA|nr:conserved hypothetical protein [Leishmania major strain Friedlin]CAG9578381.1 hypothetical_protein_-_conserved [Leishmania major strain Friedlin]CAJ06267.1 conserved hypothetical protein [Leishmania major strain Friedlin]|eukprot:XP_001684752.1 conserved hypothetical protein [Leishmania major strain Friedlin]
MTATPAPRVFLASWLEKKMEWRFTYEQRYFILDGTRLSYRLEEHGAEKKFGTIISFDPWRESLRDDTSKGYCFTVWLLEGGSWELRAATREIYDSWLHALLTVLVPSDSTSAVQSESGGMPSSHDTSVNADVAATPGGPSSGHLESESLGCSRKAGGAGERGDTISSASPTQTESADTSRKATGASPAAEGATLTATSIAAAMNASNTVSLSNVVLLFSMVEKETAWRGRWKPRYMELLEGCHLVIRSSATSKTERQHYVIEAVDPSPLVGQEVWLLFTTSSGDRFWVRYGSVEECQRWYTVCRRLLHAKCSWHWLPLAENDAGRSLRLRQATSGDYRDLQLQYHSATVVPSFQKGTWCPSLYIFGGSHRWCKQQFNPQARAFLPHAESAHTTNQLCTLELTGPHVMQLWKPAPYEEGPHALVRPLSRYGATLTCIPVEAPPSSARSDSPQQLIGARVVLFGGLSGGGYQPPATELWSVWRSPAACAEDVEMQWNRHDIPPYDLPMLAFHDAVCVPWRCAAVKGSADPYKRRHTDGGFLLVTGGLDVEYRCRAECYAVVWNDADLTEVGEQLRSTDSTTEDDFEERARLAKPVAFAFGQLPEPRAFHRMAVIEDGTVVLVGGRGVENAAAGHPVLTLAPEAWRRASKAWRDVATAATAPPESDLDGAEPKSENHCRLTSGEDEADAGAADDTDASSSQWLEASFDCSMTPTSSTALRAVTALPKEMGDVAVAATEHGNRVVVMGQVSQPHQDVKLYLLDLEPVVTPTSNGRRRGSRGINAGQQLPAGTRRVRCQEVVLFVGAVPNRVVGITLHAYNDYLFVIGGCMADNSKSEPYNLCGPLRILLE